MLWKKIKQKTDKIEPYALIVFGFTVASGAYYTKGFTQEGMFGMCIGAGFIILGILMYYINMKLSESTFEENKKI